MGTTATANDRRLLASAGGDIERACSLLSMDMEHFDGERTIEACAHVALRRRLGFPTEEAERRLCDLQAEEDRLIYARR